MIRRRIRRRRLNAVLHWLALPVRALEEAARLIMSNKESQNG